MKKDMDFLLALAADSSKIIQDDRLAKLISEYEDDELSEDELDEVCAAAKPDTEKLMRKLKGNGNKG